MERALAQHPDAGMAQANRLILARAYRRLGDNTRAVQLLREVIAQSKRHPERGADPNRRKAEKALRIWVRP
jgi:FimV-like protein